MSGNSERRISDKTAEEAKYETAKRERQRHIDAVLNSSSRKKVVVAGPGTGKTYLFERILEGKRKALTLTFVNSLVEDLSLELCGASEVKTLHGFALGVLIDAEKKKAEQKKVTEKNIKVFPKLGQVIHEDAKILLEQDINFDRLFHERDDANVHIEFYNKRKDYYGHYGFPAIVFAAVKYFQKDKNRIPSFGQAVVDEFQDFNALEVSLVDLLAEKSPILLVGDDDQALYESLKSASPKHIRQRHSGENSGYAAFCLPYCSRCTRVIVEATNDIITAATKNDYLRGRISKPFRYLDDENKNRHSDENAHIIYRQLQASQIPLYIQIHIEKIAKEIRKKFTVLIISPTNVKCKIIVDALKNKGFKSVNLMEKKDTKEPPTLLDGLKLLLIDSKCNLGWRIVAKKMLGDTDFGGILKETDKDEAKSFSDLIGKDQKGEVTQMLRTLRAVRDGDQIEDETKLAELLEKVDVAAYGMARDYLKDEIKSYKPTPPTPPLSNPGIRKIPITVTTIQSSKGLEADYVFITYFDDKYFIKDKCKVSDEEIRNFVVSLTRARRKVFLFSSDTKEKPLFLNWIDTKRICQMNATGNPAS